MAISGNLAAFGNHVIYLIDCWPDDAVRINQSSWTHNLFAKYSVGLLQFPGAPGNWSRPTEYLANRLCVQLD